MMIKDLFVKPIDRDIKGVIKVGQDDSSNVRQELEEYVVTRELQKHFAEFFSSYKRGILGTTDKMGVWISGFFGSGKSHFLKILSYLLDNREVDGKAAIDYFIDDKKIIDNAVLADMRLAANVPTDVVLFNIDSKGETSGKQSKDVNRTPSRGQRKNIKFFRPAAIRCWPFFMRRGKAHAFPSASGRPDYAGHVLCCNNGCSSQSFERVPAYW